MENEAKKGSNLKLKVSKWSEDLYFRIQYKAKLKVTVESTVKPHGQALFLTRFRLVHPFRLSQTLAITKEIMEDIEKFLLVKYPRLRIPSVSHGSE